MSEHLTSFIDDINDIEKTFSVIKSLEEFRSVPMLTVTPEDDPSLFNEKAINLHLLVDEARNGLVKIPGIFILYIGGRFEDYVKTIFEEFSIQIAKKHPSFESLPKKFKSSIINDTSSVISNLKKYGQRDGMQKTFIENLFKNVIQDNFDNINHQCLSITEGNMRSDILNELFAKIAIDNIWDSIGQQAIVKTYFETSDNSFSISNAKKYLDDFMVQRNKVAHPSGGSITWPSYDDVIKHINYFKVISKVLLELGNMKIQSIQTITS